MSVLFYIKIKIDERYLPTDIELLSELNSCGHQLTSSSKNHGMKPRPLAKRKTGRMSTILVDTQNVDLIQIIRITDGDTDL
jgi:hypothetical protein